MKASSTSSSDRRSHTRHRRSFVALALAAGALLAATWPAQAYLVRREFATSSIGTALNAAVDVAGARPLVAFIGTSQTMSGIDALAIERTLARSAEGDPAPPFVADIAIAGTHVSAFPAMLRALLARTTPRLVVLELGHIAHDQYGGGWITRNFVDDAPVLDALRDCPRGRELTDMIDSERRYPWLAIPRTARVVIDAGGRGAPRGSADEISARMRTSRGFDPYRTVKDADHLVRTLGDDFDSQGGGVIDASPQQCFVATAKLCQDICRERGVSLLVLMQPVNRAIAPRVPVLRHFEEVARGETIPALRAAGIDVLVPPDQFFDSALFYDHVHLHEQGAEQFTAWLGEDVARRLEK